MRNKQQISFSKNVAEESSFYGLVSLLFPETSSEAPIDINILDTLFVQQDNFICYVYKVKNVVTKDVRKGLLKFRQRGIAVCDAFTKRKSKKKGFTSKTLYKKKSTITLGD